MNSRKSDSCSSNISNAVPSLLTLAVLPILCTSCSGTSGGSIWMIRSMFSKSIPLAPTSVVINTPAFRAKKDLNTFSLFLGFNCPCTPSKCTPFRHLSPENSLWQYCTEAQVLRKMMIFCSLWSLMQLMVQKILSDRWGKMLQRLLRDWGMDVSTNSSFYFWVVFNITLTMLRSLNILSCFQSTCFRVAEKTAVLIMEGILLTTSLMPFSASTRSPSSMQKYPILLVMFFIQWSF